MNNNSRSQNPSVGIVGFGAFGQLAALHLAPYFEITAYDPSPDVTMVARQLGVRLSSLHSVSQADVILIAAPVPSFEQVVGQIAVACRPGALVVDVGSVKVVPTEIMRRLLPSHADIVATHPLFGPQSASAGIEGLKIALCPIRGRRHVRLAAFLRKVLGLAVIMTTPEEHDREAAVVQGLTHLIAKVLLRMGPLPTRMTTRSFDLLSEAISMVQHDAPEVFEAIEKANPYAEKVRRQFFDLAAALSVELETTLKIPPHNVTER
ncbi:prephenate dehydrogenase/arogenate dehydrogenase family protein [uncultured Roseobacter sp.]|uniref:prephenate dehydrogenase/arogenate dehydrogenase family protein n=1 Tax=uncultured Roseobacter sp. TaxID=114847 RepID=UPI002606EA59|nr:prephenate dehydrogenase/arogenate dehydrogenase family protein [uncultured Roseobacter sp.]